MDFAMNFNNWYQDEVQAAYWCGMQTTIHATINFFRCPRDACNELVTLALVHITDNLKHDSFLSRAAQSLTFKYLAKIGIPLDLIIQFCNNCASQYNSRWPFAELARIALPIIRVYFGEKHGKSHADALFGRLKAWMTYNIRSRHFIIKNAHDFFHFCRDHYQTPVQHNCCQHYPVEFEFIRPCNVRRSQDCDLDKPVDGTHNIYSVRNTPQPLQLKVRNIPCLCPPCISENGQCHNFAHADPWRSVDLIPQKGASMKKYEKRKRPDIGCRPQLQDQAIAEEIDENSDDELPDITFEEIPKSKTPNEKNNRKTVTENITETLLDNGKDVNNKVNIWIPIAEEIKESDFITPSSTPTECIEIERELIDLCEESSEEFRLACDNVLMSNVNSQPVTESQSSLQLQDEEIPDEVYWQSILTAMESCQDYDQLVKLVHDLNEKGLRPLAACQTGTYDANVDRINQVA